MSSFLNAQNSYQEKAVRLDTKKISDLTQNGVEKGYISGIYVVPGVVYVGKDPTSKDLKIYKYTDVVDIVNSVFGHVAQMDIDSSTVLIIAPDNWDRMLPPHQARYASKLRYMPFYVVLHNQIADLDKLKKLKTPSNALSIIKREELLKALSKNDMLMALPNSGTSLSMELPPDDLPDEFSNFTFSTTVNSRRGRDKRSSVKKNKNKKSKKKNKKRSKSQTRRTTRKSKSKKRLSSITRRRTKRDSRNHYNKIMRKLENAIY